VGLEVYQGRCNKAPEYQGAEDEPPTWELPDEDLFKAELVGVRLDDGRIQWLDLSGRYLPFGTVRLTLEGARVLAVGRSAAFFDRLPRTGLESAGTALEADLEISAPGGLRGTLREHTFGAAAAALKEQIAALDAASCRTLVQGELESFFRGANLLEMDLPGVGELGTPLAITARFERGGYLQAGAPGRLSCPTGLRPMKLVSELAADPARKFPLKVAAPRVNRETMRFRLAPELEVAALPADVVLAGQFGTYALVFERAADGFTVRRQALLGPQTVAPGDYEKFAAFCRQVDDAEKAQVTLRRRDAGGERK
jgi:hypothetical protein